MACSPPVAVQVLQLLLKTLQAKEPLAGDEESTPRSLAVSVWLAGWLGGSLL